MKSRVRRVYVPKARLAVVLFAVFLVAVLFIKGMLMVRNFMTVSGVTPVTLLKLVFDSGADLKPIDGRVNILLLGVAGGTHDGPDLTDTILVMSMQPEKHTIAMISVPRDIWSDTLKDKVNSAYHYGQEKRKGGGLVLSKAIVSDIIGLPIQYALVLDFSGFQRIIDLVGGIDVDVPKAFTDTEYPIPGREDDDCGGDPDFRCRYESLSFDAGLQTMNGERALKYVRSRHADGDEGSDFSRSKRQQEVILALKNKLLSRDITMHPQEFEKLYSAFDSATDTDMNMGELLTVGKIFLKTPKEMTTRISLENELYVPPSNWYGRYVLLPKENFPALHSFVRSQLP